MTDTPRFDATPSVSNHFSWLRTGMGLERTFMAWIRTAVSLIGFGFTIVQFFQRLQDSDGGLHKLRPEAPRDLGMALIATGIASLAIASWQYRRMVRYLGADEFKPVAGLPNGPHKTPIFGAAMVLLVIGVFALFTVFFHVM